MEKVVLLNRITNQLEIVTNEELENLKLTMFMAKRPFHIYYRVLPEMEACHSCRYEEGPCKYCYGLSMYTKKGETNAK